MPINAASVAIGFTSAVCGSATYRTVKISEELRGMEGGAGGDGTLEASDNLRALEARAPGSDPTRTVLYFHGGGHWLLDVNTYREFVGRLSAVTGARVVAVAYRKPPQVRFPAGLEDALCAWRWARAQHPASSVAIAGDSSGANLAFALAVKLAQLDEDRPAALIGISPWLLLDMKGRAPEELYGRFCVDLYLGGRRKVAAPSDPLVSPLNAGPELLSRFPPILMHAGTNEVTTNDVKAMQAACERVGPGLRVETQLYPAPHIFQVAPGFPSSTQDSLSRIDAFLQEHLLPAGNTREM